MDGLAAAAGVVPASLVVGLVTMLTTQAAARGDPVRGGLVGIRTRATRRSDAAREAGRRAAQHLTRWCAAVCALSAAAVLALDVAGGSGRTVSVTAAAGGVAAMVLLLLAVRRADVAAIRADDEVGSAS